jgi:hypothetical protein
MELWSINIGAGIYAQGFGNDIELITKEYSYHLPDC